MKEDAWTEYVVGLSTGDMGKARHFFCQRMWRERANW